MLYIIWSIGAKVHVNGVAEENIKQRSISHVNILTVPTPFNTLLWRIVIVDDHSYHEGYYSLLDPSRKVSMSRHPLNRELLSGIENHWPVRRLQWFTHGFFRVRNVGGDVVLADLRMGLEPNYVFQFKVADMANPHALPLPNQRYETERGWEKLPWVWNRIWYPDLDTVSVSDKSSTSYTRNQRDFIHRSQTTIG